MITKYGRYIPLVLLIVLFYTIANIFITYRNLDSIQENENWIDHTNEVRLELKEVYSNLTTLITNQRGYLLTGDQKYKSEYTSMLASVKKDLDTLHTLTVDNSMQQKNLMILQKKINARIEYLKEGITLRDQSDYDPSKLTSILQNGKKTMNGVQSALTTLDQEELALLSMRESATERSYQVLKTTVVIGEILTIGFIVLAYYLLRRELDRRNELEHNKDEFISMASHELKTPITSLKVYLHIVRNELKRYRNQNVGKYMDRVDGQIQKLSILVNDLLDITRIQTGKLRIEKEPFNLNQMAKETIEELQATTKKHKIVLKGKISGMVYGDRYRVYQALVNFMTNAIKYSPRGGDITVTLKKKVSYVIVSVEDQGIGIEKKDQGRIFDRLYQVSDTRGRTYPGLGVGLYITKQIIEQQDGKVWVESKKNKGSIFSFSLPLAKKTSRIPLRIKIRKEYEIR